METWCSHDVFANELVVFPSWQASSLSSDAGVTLRARAPLSSLHNEVPGRASLQEQHQPRNDSTISASGYPGTFGVGCFGSGPSTGIVASSLAGVLSGSESD